MIKPINIALVLMSVLITLSFAGCERQEPGNMVTDETQTTQETSETSSDETSLPFVVKRDIAKNIFGIEGSLKANNTIIVGPASLQETVITEDLQSSIDFLRKSYKDLDSIVADYPDLLSTRVVDEYGQERYTLSDKLTLSVYGEKTIVLESQSFHTPLSEIKTLPMLNLIHVAEYIVLTNSEGIIQRAYLSNNRYQDIYYGDYLGDEALELAFVYYDAMDIHFFSLKGDAIEPIVLNALFQEIDTQTQAILDDRSFEVRLLNNPSSPVTSIEKTHASVLPEKLYLNIAGGTLNDAPFFKLISSAIDKETMKAVLTCRWMWTNGLMGNINLAEVIYVFEDQEVNHIVQQKVNMQYSDQYLVNRAFEYSEVVIKQNGKVLIDTTASVDKQLQYFDLKEPFVLPEASGSMEVTRYFFERSGLSLEFAYFDDMLTNYTLILTNTDYTLGESFKVGMSQDELISLLGVPDLENNRDLFGDLKWSYYVKTETGENLLNYYYGYKKVVFTFDEEKVKEIRVVIFSSPT